MDYHFKLNLLILHPLHLESLLSLLSLPFVSFIWSRLIEDAWIISTDLSSFTDNIAIWITWSSAGWRTYWFVDFWFGFPEKCGERKYLEGSWIQGAFWGKLLYIKENVSLSCLTVSMCNNCLSLWWYLLVFLYCTTKLAQLFDWSNRTIFACARKHAFWHPNLSLLYIGVLRRLYYLVTYSYTSCRLSGQFAFSLLSPPSLHQFWAC